MFKIHWIAPLVPVETLFLRSSHLISQPLFSLFELRVYKSEGYSVAEILFVFTPASITTQNKLLKKKRLLKPNETKIVQK